MVVADYLGNLRIVVHLGKDSLPDHGVLLHVASFFKSQSPGFFKETGWKSNFPDVVDESAQMRKLLLSRLEPKACSDVTRIDCNGCGVTGRVLISRVKRGDQSAGEG